MKSGITAPSHKMNVVSDIFGLHVSVSMCVPTPDVTERENIGYVSQEAVCFSTCLNFAGLSAGRGAQSSLDPHL